MKVRFFYGPNRICVVLANNLVKRESIGLFQPQETRQITYARTILAKNHLQKLMHGGSVRPI